MRNLDKESWEEVTFQDIAEHVEINEKNNSKRQIAKYVGVEHLETLNLKIQGFANEEQPTFNRTFRKGEILFAKRRAYQKKVAIAEFDGICSPHLWAIKTKNGFLQELLAFIMQMDSFYEYVNANSAGTMSTYLKWNALSLYKIKKPPIKEQNLILKILKNLEQIIILNKEQIIYLNNVKREMIDLIGKNSIGYGNIDFKKKFKQHSIESVSMEINERIDKPSKAKYLNFLGLEHFSSGEIILNKYGTGKNLISSMKLCEKDDVLFARRNVYLKRTSLTEQKAMCSGDVIVIRPNRNLINPIFLTLILNTKNFWDFSISNAAGTMSKRVKWRDLKNYEFNLPELEIQNKIINPILKIETLTKKVYSQIEILKVLKNKILNKIFL